MAVRSVRLQVAAARQEESGQGIARLPRLSLSRREQQIINVVDTDSIGIGVRALVDHVVTFPPAPAPLAGTEQLSVADLHAWESWLPPKNSFMDP